MDESILDSVKKLLGISPDYTQFDTDIIIHINSVLSILRQMGAGPEEGYVISDNTARWSDFVGDNIKLSMIKSYVFMKVRLMFDPPQIGSVMDSLQKQVAELEWRINAVADYPNS